MLWIPNGGSTDDQPLKRIGGHGGSEFQLAELYNIHLCESNMKRESSFPSLRPSRSMLSKRDFPTVISRCGSYMDDQVWRDTLNRNVDLSGRVTGMRRWLCSDKRVFVAWLQAFNTLLPDIITSLFSMR